jgi:hypothetical protein
MTWPVSLHISFAHRKASVNASKIQFDSLPHSPSFLLSCRIHVHLTFPTRGALPMTSLSPHLHAKDLHCVLEAMRHGSRQPDTLGATIPIRDSPVLQSYSRSGACTGTSQAEGIEPPTWRRNLLFLSLRRGSFPVDTLLTAIAAIRVRR